MIWLLITMMTAVALAFLVMPLLRSRAAQPDRGKFDLAVYRDQLREIDDEVARQTLSVGDAELARREIKRRMLAVPKDQSLSVARPGRAGAIALAIVVPALALSLYLPVGQPQLPGHEFADRPAAAGDGRELLPDVETLAQQLAARLEKSPNDAKGWRMLGWSYFSIEKYPEAVKAYAHAVTLSPKDSDLRSAYGEAVIRAAGGFVTPQARKVIAATLALNPKDSRARFFHGLALEQENKHRQALDVWLAIARDGPADADWMPGLRERVRSVAAKLKLDGDKLLPLQTSSVPISSIAAVTPPAAGPDQTQVEAATQLDPQARQAMIDGMVAGLVRKLAAAPKNLDGWIMLARSRKVLGDAAAADKALARAREEFAGDTVALGKIANAARELGLAAN